MKWREWFRALHRDVGYVAAALVIAYAISGIAVNHIADWNPNYKFREDAVNIGPLPSEPYAEMERFVAHKLALDPDSIKGHFMASETVFRVFLTDSQEVSVDVRTGRGVHKRVDTRPVLYELNVLHLNSVKGWWTWIADLFALALLWLVISGLAMVKGRNGLAGRGKWYVGAGLLIPVALVVYLYV